VSEWPKARIEDVTRVVAMGPFGSSIKVETFVAEGVPVISGQHLRGSKVDVSADFNFVAPDHADRLRNANVRPGDVVFTHAGNIGQVAMVPRHGPYDRYVISQRQFYARCDTDRILPEYLVAFFKTAKGQHLLLANTSQVGVPSIARPVSYLRTVEVPVPPLDTQQWIVGILGALDDKIELNRRMNETLEAIARALFKSWFVDFDPVRAKAEGRDTGLPRALADLFPDAFVDSELGEVPQGWGVNGLDEMATYLNGLALQKYPSDDRGSLPVIKIAQLRAGHVNPDPPNRLG
jgi:type I restriction enzyme S subunit